MCGVFFLIIILPASSLGLSQWRAAPVCGRQGDKTCPKWLPLGVSCFLSLRRSSTRRSVPAARLVLHGCRRSDEAQIVDMCLSHPAPVFSQLFLCLLSFVFFLSLSLCYCLSSPSLSLCPTFLSILIPSLSFSRSLCHSCRVYQKLWRDGGHEELCAADMGSPGNL